MEVDYSDNGLHEKYKRKNIFQGYKNDRHERYHTLFVAGRMPSVAHDINNKWTVSEYEETLTEPAFFEWTDNTLRLFTEGIEGKIIAQLLDMEVAIRNLHQTDPNFPKILKEYRELLKLSQPIVDRLSKANLDNMDWQNTRLQLITKDDN